MIENKFTVLLCGLFLVLGIFGTLLVTDTTPEKEIVYVNKTVTVPGEKEIVYVEKPIMDDSVFKKLYSEEIEQLETDALDCYLEEFDEEDFEDSLKDLIEDFDKLISFEEDLDEEEVEALNLGLEDEEDKLASVYKEYSIKYELDNSYDKLKGTIVSEAEVTYDEEDGFECEIVYSLK